MTLLITVFAAVIATVKWYTRKDDSMQLGLLCCLYWGASLMWLVDAVFEYAELGAEYFTPAAADMLNDAFLGLSAVALGLVDRKSTRLNSSHPTTSRMPSSA